MDSKYIKDLEEEIETKKEENVYQINLKIKKKKKSIILI